MLAVHQNSLLMQVLLSQWNYSGIWSELIYILSSINGVSKTDFEKQEIRPLYNHGNVKSSQEKSCKEEKSIV